LIEVRPLADSFDVSLSCLQKGNYMYKIILAGLLSISALAAVAQTAAPTAPVVPAAPAAAPSAPTAAPAAASAAKPAAEAPKAAKKGRKKEKVQGQKEDRLIFQPPQKSPAPQGFFLFNIALTWAKIPRWPFLSPLSKNFYHALMWWRSLAVSFS
jgi:hypothetical protein